MVDYQPMIKYHPIAGEDDDHITELENQQDYKEKEIAVIDYSELLALAT